MLRRLLAKNWLPRVPLSRRNLANRRPPFPWQQPRFPHTFHLHARITSSGRVRACCPPPPTAAPSPSNPLSFILLAADRGRPPALPHCQTAAQRATHHRVHCASSASSLPRTATGGPLPVATLAPRPPPASRPHAHGARPRLLIFSARLCRAPLRLHLPYPPHPPPIYTPLTPAIASLHTPRQTPQARSIPTSSSLPKQLLRDARHRQPAKRSRRRENSHIRPTAMARIELIC